MGRARSAIVGVCALALGAGALGGCSLETDGTESAVAESHPEPGSIDGTAGAGAAGDPGTGGAAGEAGAGAAGAIDDASSAADGVAGGAGTDANDASAAGAGGGPVTQDAATDVPLEGPPPGPCIPGTNKCDLDCDGYRAPGGGCGGDDCCDADADAHLGQTSFFTHPDACGSFDYDCNFKEEPEWGTGKKCSLGLFSCDVSEGFESGPPGCGQSGAWAACTSDFWGGCNDDPGSRTQGCR
jgi:hypothetical protein